MDNLIAEKPSELINSVTRQEVDEVFNEFTSPSDEVMYKLLVEQFKGSDKAIKGFGEFLQAKAYKKRYPDATDEQRYSDMIRSCLKHINESGSLDNYLVNKQLFFDALGTFLQGEDVYATVSESFLKGSFKAVGEKIGRILKPKDDDDPYSGFSEVERYVKQYSLNFISLFTNTFSKNGCNLYSIDFDITGLENPEDLVKQFVLDMCANDYLFFGTVKGITEDSKLNTVMTIMIATTSEVQKYSQNKILMSDFIVKLESNEYEPIYIDNFVSMGAIKKLFTVKNKDTFQEMMDLLTNVKKRHGIYFYMADYIDMSGFNGLIEDNIPNILKGLVASTEDYASGLAKDHPHSKGKVHPHGVLISFQLNGTVGNLQIKSWWASIEPIEDCVPDFDREAFNWTSVSIEEYVKNMKVRGELATEYVHS